ncbi:E3 ubiquitin-protein ligase RNF125 [Drosophila mauritiana]|uniref:E3 ubiquitin-protein ligase RNF125 n=1 Tax=Drosophila mauritiana TaxID=7226 RepID=A0A6P8LBV8_DROMA|nr:E3 ubiquitin-protein ligase RNF125 [Drosophila mauritiana]
MFPSWLSLLHWKPLKMEGLRRAGDGIMPLDTIDLTTTDEERPVVRLLSDSNNGYYLCPICKSLLDQPVTTTCGHIFCKECLTTALDQLHYCPLCNMFVLDFFRIYF